MSLHKSTVFRLLATMEARGLVEQDSNRGRYSLADGIVRLAEGAHKRHDLALIGRDICVALAQEVGESIYIAIRDGRDVVSIDQVIGPSSLTTLSEVGRRDPLHASSCGKVFLADLPGPGTPVLHRWRAAAPHRLHTRRRRCSEGRPRAGVESRVCDHLGGAGAWLDKPSWRRSESPTAIWLPPMSHSLSIWESSVTAFVSPPPRSHPHCQPIKSDYNATA